MSWFAVMSSAGASSVTGATVNDGTYSDTDVPGNTATAGVTFNTSGQVVAIGDSGTEYTWLNSGAAGDYEIRATLQSGSVDSGTTGSWLALSSSRSWSIDEASNIQQAELLIEIRDVATSTVIDSGTSYLTAIIVA